MRSHNRIELIGNVGNDVELRHTSGGTAVVNLSLATNSRADNEGNERVDWHRLVLFGNKALLAKDYIKKGDRLRVEGRVQYSTYEKEVAKGIVVDWPTTDIWVQDIMFLTPKAEDTEEN